jgi:hypothetical protein
MVATGLVVFIWNNPVIFFFSFFRFFQQIDFPIGDVTVPLPRDLKNPQMRGIQIMQRKLITRKELE